MVHKWNLALCELGCCGNVLLLASLLMSMSAHSKATDLISSWLTQPQFCINLSPDRFLASASDCRQRCITNSCNTMSVISGFVEWMCLVRECDTCGSVFFCFCCVLFCVLLLLLLVVLLTHPRPQAAPCHICQPRRRSLQPPDLPRPNRAQ